MEVQEEMTYKMSSIYDPFKLLLGQKYLQLGFTTFIILLLRSF